MKSKKGIPPLPSKIPYPDMSVSHFPFLYESARTKRKEVPLGANHLMGLRGWPFLVLLPALERHPSPEPFSLTMFTCKRTLKPGSFCKDWARILG